MSKKHPSHIIKTRNKYRFCHSTNLKGDPLMCWPFTRTWMICSPTSSAVIVYVKPRSFDLCTGTVLPLGPAESIKPDIIVHSRHASLTSKVASRFTGNGDGHLIGIHIRVNVESGRPMYWQRFQRASGGDGRAHRFAG